MPLSKAHLTLLSTGSTKKDPSRYNSNIVDWDIKNQTPIVCWCFTFMSWFVIRCFKAAIIVNPLKSKYSLSPNTFGTHWILRIGPVHDLF